MPSYTFCCQNCGDFTLILKTMTGKKDRTECPDCLEESTRVYLPPNLFSYSKELRTRFEKGMEPRRMTREELGPKQKIKNKSASRPWQVGN
ncbi:FmdB family zinc ribbon protein [Cytobacillus praedii]|uniref:FmdB family zinc ribbon protein n=1 Tax=Cytobacillus praedii TaxID=1742358 RepID=UPI002E2113BC|nr:zinc ribbon domain-containing protein [Cytobacillus praedii]